MSNYKQQTDAIRKRFFQLNNDRLSRTKTLMTSKHRVLLDVIPFLFHINHTSVIGYVDDKTPLGIGAYTPDENVIAEAKRLWRGFDYRKQSFWTFDIEAIFLMGSCGTIAFNQKSDFDIWLVYHPNLERAQLKRLQKKARKIEEWFDEIDLEVHFFLMNAESFKAGKVSALSTESSGTAQYHLLLDEFYRTSIWLAGKPPLWWFVPPEKERNYEKIRLHLIKENILTENEYVDFGALPDIPSGEYFGAAVWQIYKGIDSPYKSILKITLMESYASSYPKSLPLSAEFKKIVYDGLERYDNINPDDIDPYLMMLNRIEKYLIKHNKTSRLDVIHRSFYLKLNLALSDSREPDNWRRQSVERLVKKWGWLNVDIKHFDNQNNWQLEDVAKERKLLIRQLTESYTFLSGFARKNASKRLIREKDLSILGRKLYSVFDRKVGKVEIFNRGITDNISESSITIMLLHGKDGREHWRLYRGKVVGDRFKDFSPLKQTVSLIELLAWVYFNQLFSDDTRKLMYAPGSDLGNSELMTLLSLFSNFPQGKGLSPDSKDLLKNAYVQQSEVFLNIGRSPKIVGSFLDKQLISGEIDVFNYGTEDSGLIQTIEYCFVTSWKEIFTFKYYGVDGMAKWLCALLQVYRNAAQSELSAMVFPAIHSFKSHVSQALSRRIQELNESVVKCFIRQESPITTYVYEAGQFYYLIYENQEGFGFEKFSDQVLLINYLSIPVAGFRNVANNQYCLALSPLTVMYKKNKKNIIQLFLMQTNSHTLAYVIDEKGCLFFQKVHQDRLDIVASHYQTFFDSIVERAIVDHSLSEIKGFSDDFDHFSRCDLEVFFMKKSKSGFIAKLQSTEVSHSPVYNIQAVADVVENKTVFTFYCEDKEFSSMDWGAKIFREVAKYIYQKRKEKQKYHMYITDLTICPLVINKKTSHNVQTSELLNYKKKIEGYLNKALVGL